MIISARNNPFTLWISFPDYDTLPEIVLTGTGIQ